MKIKKVNAGNNHCQILADKIVYTFGDSETAALGRKPCERRRDNSEYEILPAIKHVVDCWTGGYHNVCRVEKSYKGKTTVKYFSWGLNQYG